MRRAASLSRKIAVRMAIVTLSGLAVAALFAFSVYMWVFENHPEAVPPPSEWLPQPIDYLAIAGAVAAAVGIAVASGVQLARRIVLPLTSLAETARRIAGGDLSARAVVGDRTIGETARLVDDFNAMAAQLERLADGMVTWNASIAHELRTPLTILKGRLQGVWDGVFDMDEATLVSLLKQVDGLARLVEDLRVVSLAESGHLHLQLEEVDLAQVIGDLEGAVSPGLAAAGFTPQWRLETAKTVCDPVRLRQAVLALIENARVHATPGPLVVETHATPDGVRILVQDSGPGLAEGFEALAFDSFRRGNALGGSGLGLSVVRAVAEAHGGGVAYRRVEGGSVFEIRTP
ncbi:ATP-binding protein [Brevundimonas faecalis]|uniref:histidine kinase n=1 Tax=Brevundimonas faecalis TaxID=947378 RepID=A0ABV2R6Y9_9CAUL